MTAVRQLHAVDENVTLREAITAYLATLDHPESQGTRRVYASTLRTLRSGFGDDSDLAGMGEAAVTAWFTRTWGEAAPATWNRNRDALRSASRHWQDQGWITGDLAAGIRRRRRAPDRSRALSRADVEQLLTREDLAIRERALWRLLYESAARSAEVLRLDVANLDLANRRARVIRKGSAVDIITWRTGTARLLPRLLKGRKSGPVFLTDRRARVELPPCDLDAVGGRARLSYRQAAQLFEEASAGMVGGPWTLHQLRHSALTHAAEEGASTSTLLAYSGHASVQSLARYARASPEALGRWQAQRDPAKRR
jgi:integrase/recombinase XerC/integrase/recombinase XerD